MFLDCIGSISRWVQFAKADNLVIQLNHSFQKQSSLSQFNILGPNGPKKLSVPTSKSTRKGSYKDVHISNESAWQSEHWKSIESAYLKSPFFIYYDYKLEAVFKEEYADLLRFNKAMMIAILDCLKLGKEVDWDKETVAYYKESEVIQIPEYPQVFDYKLPFQGDLSVLDALFNLGPETASYLLSISTS